MNEIAETCPIIDPAGPATAAVIPVAPGLATLAGRRVAVLDIAKIRSDAFVDQVEAGLREHESSLEIERSVAPPSRRLPDDEVANLAGHCDGAVLAVADCGTCSSWTLFDAIELHRHGCRAVLVISEELRPTIDALAGRLGMDDLPLVEVPLPNRDQTRADIAAAAEAATPAILAALTG
jgi:hypothetical protein